MYPTTSAKATTASDVWFVVGATPHAEYRRPAPTRWCRCTVSSIGYSGGTTVRATSTNLLAMSAFVPPSERRLEDRARARDRAIREASRRAAGGADEGERRGEPERRLGKAEEPEEVHVALRAGERVRGRLHETQGTPHASTQLGVDARPLDRFVERQPLRAPLEHSFRGDRVKASFGDRVTHLFDRRAEPEREAEHLESILGVRRLRVVEPERLQRRGLDVGIEHPPTHPADSASNASPPAPAFVQAGSSPGARRRTP